MAGVQRLPSNVITAFPEDLPIQCGWCHPRNLNLLDGCFQLQEGLTQGSNWPCHNPSQPSTPAPRVRWSSGRSLDPRQAAHLPKSGAHPSPGPLGKVNLTHGEESDGLLTSKFLDAPSTPSSSFSQPTSIGHRLKGQVMMTDSGSRRGS